MTMPQSFHTDLDGIDGEIVEPADPGYDDARAVYNAMIDRRPLLVVRPASVGDVRAVLEVADRHLLPLAVRGGGHNGAGLGTVDGGVVLDLRGMQEVEVDPERRTVRVGGGATWGMVDRATGQYGLATPSGIISTTGVGGLTLGGGLGHLTRAYGLTIDNLLGADVVLADGRLVHASEEDHPDLFWALRGGGGNFGVVTAFTFRLNDVSDFAAGPVFWPVEQAEEVMRVYREFIPATPRELSGFFAFTVIPPAPPFPEELHGMPVCGIVFAGVRGEAEGRRLMQPLLDAVPQPLVDGFGPIAHADMQAAFDGIYPPHDQWYWRADFVNTIPDEAVALHRRFGGDLPTPQSTMHLYPIDGAVHDVATDATAFAYRDATYGSVFAGVDHDPANAQLVKRWTIDYFEALHPFSAGGAYVNMMMDEGDARVRASYRGNYERLALVKREYDPGNVFKVNQNITPALAA